MIWLNFKVNEILKALFISLKYVCNRKIWIKNIMHVWTCEIESLHLYLDSNFFYSCKNKFAQKAMDFVTLQIIFGCFFVHLLLLLYNIHRWIACDISTIQCCFLWSLSFFIIRSKKSYFRSNSPAQRRKCWKIQMKLISRAYYIHIFA